MGGEAIIRPKFLNLQNVLAKVQGVHVCVCVCVCVCVFVCVHVCVCVYVCV